MTTQALLLAYLLAAALLCHGIVASPASIAADKLVFMGGMELRRPMIDGMMTANQTAAQQLPTEERDGIGHRLQLSWFPLLSDVTSPLVPFVEQGIVLDHLLVILAVFVVYFFR